MTDDAVARLINEGPRVAVSVSRWGGGRRQAPAMMLIDTGAGMTTLRTSVVAAVKLSPHAETLITGATDTAPVLVPVVRVQLTLPGIAPFNVDACVLERDDDDVDGLLGRDALAFLTLTYRGGLGRFSLDPS